MSQPLAMTMSCGSPSPQQNSDHRVDKTESKRLSWSWILRKVERLSRKYSSVLNSTLKQLLL